MQLTKDNKHQPKLEFVNYDKRNIKIPIQKRSWWFNDKHRGAQHCTVMCNNSADVFLITKKRVAKLGYCFTHAELRLARNTLYGLTENGIWCWVVKDKLVPFYYYNDFLKIYQKLHPDKAKKLKEKIKEYKKHPIIVWRKSYGKFKKSRRYDED